MSAIKYLNLLVSFLLEIALLIIAGYWGFQQGESVLMKYMLAITLPVVIAVFWGIFAAPKSRKRLKNPSRTIFKLALFALAVFFCFQTGHSLLAVVLAVATLMNVIAAYTLSQDY
ncbi:MAG TPA: YrdB family protein [Draconibacterium sp.]|nr:YrdB family protein [Draconibacterium sp.]